MKTGAPGKLAPTDSVRLLYPPKEFVKKVDGPSAEADPSKYLFRFGLLIALGAFAGISKTVGHS
jgi:hypothetical protein